MEIVSWSAAREPERPAIISARDHLAAEELGDGMDPAAYAALEAEMWRHPLARQGLRLWALVEGDAVLATFETYPVVVRARLGDGVVLRKGIVLGSGFVAPEARRSGHGKKLSAAAVVGCVREDGAVFAYGTSETSPKVYRDVPNVTTETLMVRSWPIGQGGPRPSEVELLHDLSGWTEPPLEGSHDVLITPELLDWRLRRVAASYPADAGRPIGARLGDDRVIWVRAGDDGELELLHLRAHASTIGPLLAAAQAEAEHRGLERVTAWENAENRAWLPDGEREPLDDLLMVARFAPEVAGDGAWRTIELGHNL